MRIVVVGALLAMLAAACGPSETPWEATPDPAVRAAVVEAASIYGEDVLAALPMLIPTGAFDSPGRSLDTALSATDTWWVVVGVDGRPVRMLAFTTAEGRPPQLAGSDWADPASIVAATAAAGRNPRVVSAWGHRAVLGEGDDGIVAVPLALDGLAGEYRARPIATYSDQLREMSRGGGAGIEPWAFAGLAAFAAFVVSLPVVVLASRSLRGRRA